MMRKLDNRGAAAWEFLLVAVPLFTLVAVIFDLGRYAIMIQSLRTLADVGARAIMIQCYTPDLLQTPPTTPSGCATADPNPLTTAQMQAAAPVLYWGSLAPTLSVAAGASSLTVTASESGFAMLMPVWPTAFNTASATTSIPF
jgi:Flp pilus assembly protein TadG